MFRTMSGFKTQYHYLTLVVISEFNEWKVVLHSPSMMIQGTHQFTEAKAKEHAVAIARTYIHEHKHDELPVLGEAAWIPTAPEDWLIWKA
ncbi:MAG: hypothetical protein LAP40_19310 [Acidobacteriia bacterium]|nr:hypothetical protein [Terriglobia bacterium]